LPTVSPPPTVTPSRKFIDRLWRWLVEPSSRLQPHFRARSQLLSILCLIQIPAVVLMAYWDWGGILYYQFAVLIVGLAFTAYLLNRRGYYRPAAIIALAWVSAHPYMLLLSWNVFTQVAVLTALMRVILAIVLSNILFDLRGTVISVAGNLLFLALSPFILDLYPLEAVLVPLYLSTAVGMLVMLAAVMRHFDQRQKETQRHALEESEDRYRTLFNATFEGIAVQSGGKMVDANPVFEKMFGYTLEEMRGMSVLNFFAPEYRQLASEWINTSYAYEAEGLRKDGTRFWGEVKVKDGTYKGKAVRIAAVQDITERKQADDQRVELTIEREKVNVLKRFIGNLSHDLRTPLSVIKTSIYLIPRLHDEDKRQRHLEALEVETNRLQRMLDDLLSMSRLDKADTSEYRFAISQIDPLVQACVEEGQAMAIRKGQTLTYVPAESLPPVILDPTEFKRMIKHLILNAVTYTPEKGVINILTASSGEMVVIEVRDTGVGISEHELPHIFDRLYRVDLSRSASAGAGLGLSIARKIVEAHGGTIEVDSMIGIGSTFRVRLPSAKALQTPTSGAAVPGAAVSRMGQSTSF